MLPLGILQDYVTLCLDCCETLVATSSFEQFITTQTRVVAQMDEQYRKMLKF